LILLRDRLLSEKVTFESHWYNAGHPFFNEMGPNYDATCTQQAWERPTEFFAKRLK